MGTSTSETHRPPLRTNHTQYLRPFRKHGQGQQNESNTGSPCLDNAVLARGTTKRRDTPKTCPYLSQNQHSQ